MFLETERLILRKFQEEDFAEFLEFANDPEMCRMVGLADMSDPAAARETFDWLKDHEDRGYALILRESGKLIGNLTVSMPPPVVTGRRETAGKIGRTLSFSISRHYRRRGFAFESSCRVIERLFLIEGLDYINCGAFRFNTASRALQKKLGFAPLVTERLQVNGEEVECIESILWRV